MVRLHSCDEHTYSTRLMSCNKILYFTNTGVVLANGIDSALDLVEVGVKPLPARALFKFITKWKTDGLPVTFASELNTQDRNSHDTNTAEKLAAVYGSVPLEVFSAKRDPDTNDNNTKTNEETSPVGSLARPRWMNQTEFLLRNRLNDDYHKARCSDESATKRVQELASSGNKLASAYMSMLCGSGNAYIPFDTRQADQAALEAWTWLHTEAAKGCPFAQYCLGCSLVVGRFGEKNEQEAVKYLRMGAVQNHPGAICALGWCFQAGLGIAADASEAWELYIRAAELGHVGAAINMGNCYESGIGTEQNEVEALRLYYTAAEQGHPYGQYKLGVYHQHGKGGIAQDEVAAVRWYGLAAQQGLAAALYQLGECYEHGTGVASDALRALECYQLAADQYHLGALARLREYK